MGSGAPCSSSPESSSQRVFCALEKTENEEQVVRLTGHCISSTAMTTVLGGSDSDKPTIEALRILAVFVGVAGRRECALCMTIRATRIGGRF